MSQTNTLLTDAIERILANPGSDHAWHRFEALYGSQPAVLRTEAVEFFSAPILNAGIPGFLRATLLASLPGGAHHLERAAELLLAISPVDPDRISAFLLFAWAKLLAANCSHADFVAGIASVRFPALTQRAARILQGQIPALPQRPIRSVKKIAILASHLGNLGHTPTCMVLDQFTILHKLGYEVQVFSPQEQMPPDMSSYLGTDCNSRTGPIDASQWSAYLNISGPFSFDVHASDTRFSMLQRWRALMRQLAGFDPDLIFFVGLYAPMLFPLYQDRPVLALGTHAFAPVVPADAWLCADAAHTGRSERHWGLGLPASFACDHPYRIRDAARPSSADRAGLGLPTDKLILISVGARLPEEIAGPWAQAMLRVLAQQPNIVWLLVGGTGTMPAALAHAAPGSVMTLPHQKDIASLLAVSDIYINPPRLGGGFSVAEAMAASLPVVALRGADGGNKLGEMAAVTEEDYFLKLQALLESEASRKAAGAQLRDLFEQTLSLAHSHGSLDAAIATTLELYQRRSAAS
jgi:glycosyltransferase involved in cell wall biosynthesis